MSEQIEALRAEAEALRAENAKLRTALAEQGERQEAQQKPVGHVYTMQPCFPGEPMRAHAQLHVALPAGTKLYAEPQPGPDVRALVEALEECAASLAWNCFGECRAIHAGPIMPAAKALDTARAALGAQRQAQR